MKSGIDKSNAVRVSFAISALVVASLLFQGTAWADVVLASLTKFLSPGELTASHANEEKLKDCYACHTLTQGLDNSLCLDCHKAMKERFSNRDGYHGKLEGKCQECHTEHKGRDMDIIGLNTGAFNHRQANFQLTGKHAEIDCEKCHGKKGSEDQIQTRYINLQFEECTDCHDNPHPQGFGVNCQKCHTTAGWSGRALVYSHTLDSKYKLLGKHQEVDCDKCHKAAGPEAKFLLPKTECEQCHQDIHKGQLSKQCQTCHTERGWTGRNLKYSHAQDPKYKLLGKHQAVKCEKCHKAAQPGAKLAAAQFTNLSTECLQCHEDEHKGQLPKQCRQCHSELGWKSAFLSFNHNEQASYKLDATHQSVPCADCHADKKFKPLKSECIDCHGEYASIMAGRQPQGAASGKADPHWKRVRCDQCHDNIVKVQHIALYQDKCVGCHNQRYGPLLLDWMKDWSKLRLEVQALLRQAAEEKALSAKGLERMSRRLAETEKIGAHNFLMAPLQWNAMKADLENEISGSLANKSRDSQSSQARAEPPAD